MILENWTEAEFHQRRMKELMIELEFNKIYDDEIWTKIFVTICRKKRINNVYFFGFFLETMQKWNADPSKKIFFKQMDSKIEEYKKKHYNVDREWRYDFHGDNGIGRMRTMDEIIAKKDESKIDDMVSVRGVEDQSLMQKAAIIEKKFKRIRMAKFSVELFDEIVQEMMRDRRSMMEMMAELDVEDDQILESQQRITKARLKAGLSISANWHLLFIN